MPFRDPGHISRDQIRFDRALQAEGVVISYEKTLNLYLKRLSIQVFWQ
jgi:hypothetical protein